MLILFIGEPQRIGWHWLPGSVLVVLAITLLLRRDVGQRKASLPLDAASGHSGASHAPSTH
jgi:hypothetical protein